MVTLAEVARHAGVSASTVSYVLSGKRSISAHKGAAGPNEAAPAPAPGNVMRLIGDGSTAFTG
ncbi:LacI family DNA-binding transcriptional regulator, partial [Streptomyces sp. NPDC001940]